MTEDRIESMGEELQADHSCNAKVPRCECGYRWEWYVEYSNGERLYFSDEDHQRYLALYGRPSKGHEHKRTGAGGGE